MTRIDVAPGIVIWPGRLSPAEQTDLVERIFAAAATAPFYRATMPVSGHPLSVEMTNFGPLGWYSDQARGYRYEAKHPVTGTPWPPIPPALLSLWDDSTHYCAPPECCLVNLYRGEARMGLHRDEDEAALDAPVLSVSLGDDGVFRIGGPRRKDPTQSMVLRSGDVLMFGGPARRAYHGIDRVRRHSSRLIRGGGRINLTLRRVTVAAAQEKGARPGG